MKHQVQSYPVMQNKSLNFADQYESGYSTTTSSEEGTLQRGFTHTKKQGGFESESFLKNPKFLEMVSKETAASEARTKRTNKKRSKTYEYSESPVSLHSAGGSPRLAPSPLTFGIPDHIPTSLDELRHNYFDTTNEEAINVAALQKFKDNLENIRTYQTAKPPTFGKPVDYSPYYDPLRINDVTQGKMTKVSKSSSSSISSSGTGSPKKPSPVKGIYQQSSSSTPTKSNPAQFSIELSKSVEDLTTIKAITPPTSTQRKSAFVVVKPRVINRAKTSEGPAAPARDQSNSIYQHTCQHGVEGHHCHNAQVQRPTSLNYTSIVDQLQSPSPRDGNIVFIPAQIDENGVARPVPNNYLQSPVNSNCKQTGNHQDNERNNTKKCNHGNVTKQSKDKRTGLPPAEILSNEAVRLRKYLEKADAKNLKKVLEKLLKSKDPRSIDAMTKLFPSSKFKSDAAHCVRCHKDFNPNEPGRCILPHPEKMVTKVSQDSIGADFECRCCNAEFRLIQMDFYEESTNALLTGHCYSGTHTTDPNSVDYRSVGGCAKSCEEFGCIEFYV